MTIEQTTEALAVTSVTRALLASVADVAAVARRAHDERGSLTPELAGFFDSLNAACDTGAFILGEQITQLIDYLTAEV